MLSLKVDCKAKRSILHLIDTTGPGGAETIFIQLADMMRSRGYQSVVVIRGAGWVQEQLESRGISPVIIDAKGSFNVSFLWSLVRLIRQHKITLIHSHLLGSNVYAAMAGLLTRVPVVATYHGMVDVSPSERFRWIKHMAMRWGISRYVTVSEGLKANVLEQGLLRAEATTVIYNGIDISRYGLTDKKALRQELGFSDDTIVVGCLGNVRKAKAYDILIEAAADIKKRFPRVRFVVAGHQKPDLMAELDAQMEALDVTDRVSFIGFTEDSAAILSQLDLFLLPSVSEGFSISTIEAMATGLPVMATRCGGPEEILEHEVSGYLVESGSSKAIESGLAHLLEDAPLRQRMATKAAERAREIYSIERMLDSYDELYKQLG